MGYSDTEVVGWEVGHLGIVWECPKLASHPVVLRTPLGTPGYKANPKYACQEHDPPQRTVHVGSYWT